MRFFANKVAVVILFGVFIGARGFSQSSPVIQAINFDPRGAGANDCVSGSGFGATQGSSAVAINGSVATAVNWSDTQACFTIPAATALGAATVQITTAGGASNVLNFTVVGPPNIGGINPGSATPGAQVTISGTNFGANQSFVRLWVGNSPNFSNILYPSVVSWSDTQIVATIPANAPVGAVTLEVAANGLSTSTANKNFSIVGPPQIQRIDFDPRGAGASDCVYGAGFGASQGSSTVALNGTQVPANNWSDGQVCYTIPSSTAVGAATVQITTSAGASNALSFTVIGPPTISSITPSAAALGAQVTIAGTNFGPNQGGVRLWVGNSPNFSNILYLSVVSWSDTQVAVTIPANAPVGATTMEIANGLSTGTTAKNFTVAGPPVIQRIDFDPRGAGANSCVLGAGFGAAQGSGTVTLNGAQITAFNWSDGQVCYTIPSSTPVGAATVQITTLAGASNAFSFTVIGPPTISSITPSAAAPGAQVTIAGTNFGPNQGGVRLWVGNSPNFSNILYLSVVSWSDTQAVVTISANAPVGAVTLEIAANGLSTGTATKNFSIAGPPVIQRIDFDPRAAGASDCVFGSGFGATQSSSTVAVNGIQAAVLNWSDGQVCYTIPSSTTPGAATVQVTTPAGVSNAFGFTVVAPPMIGSLNPIAGIPGTQITINGSSFGNATGQIRLLQGGNLVSLSIISWADTQIVATIPASGINPGTATIQVLVNNSFANSQFTLLAPSGPLLQLSVADTPLQVNLSDPEIIDWVHWGRISATQPDRKAGVTPQISDYAALNGAAVTANSGVVAFSWSNGDHSSLVSETLADVESSGSGGFQITVPADTTVKTLKLYLEISRGTGILQASLSDGSAASISDQSVGDLDFGSKTYSIDFHAASAGQTLTVRFSPDTNATVGLQAATLTAHLPVVTIASPAAAQQFPAPASVPVKVNASQFDALIIDVSATGSDGTVLESSGSPLNAGWIPQVAGHYSLIATATDTAGLIGASTPVELDVIGQGGSLSLQEVVPSSPVDLDSQGSADWVLWGPVMGSGADNPGHILARRSGVAPLISEYKPIGNHFIRSVGFAHNLCFTGNQQSYCSGSELVVHGVGDGFEITVAADTAPRTLQLYVGTQSADGKVVAFLSDGSAPVVIEVGGSGPPPPPNTSHTTLYNIQFGAASPGQALTVRFTMNSDQGSGQVALIGATLGGAPVVPSVPPPQITSVTPNSASTDAKITIVGTNFGAAQGASYVQIGDQAQVVSWSDTSIEAIVPAASQVGSTVEVAVFTDHGVSNTATLNILAYKVFPAAINLLVGQSRTLSAKDNNGSPVTGLPWSTSDSNIVRLSTDDPPVITALAPGSTKVWAGDISVPVTVYAGTALPAGVPIWTLPLGSGPSGSVNLVPSVPSDSGADVFAYDITGAGTLTAISSAGEPVWRVSGINFQGLTCGPSIPCFQANPTKVIPDFSGSAVLKTPYLFINQTAPDPRFTCSQHTTHRIHRIDPVTRQLSVIYTFDDNDRRTVGVTSSCEILSDTLATEAIIPHPSGVLMVQDNARIVVLDPATAQAVATIPLDELLADSPGEDFSDPRLGSMIVAGDGNAYVPYMFRMSSQSTDSAGNTHFHEEDHLKVMRVSADGSNAKVDLGTWISNTVSDNKGTTVSASGMRIALASKPVITNADQGVAVLAQTQAAMDGHLQAFMALVSQDTATGTFNVGSLREFRPSLQREDGSYIGMDSENQLDAVALDGSVLWQKKVNPDANGNPTFVTPLYATADGGAMVTSTTTSIGPVTVNDPSCANAPQPQSGPCVTQPGTMYTLDRDGGVTVQAPDTGALQSWTDESYIESGSVVSSVPRTAIQWAIGYTSMVQGNLSRSGASIGVFEAVEGFPVFGLPSWGVTCKLGTEKVLLTGDALAKYDDLKQNLLMQGSLTSQKCSAFFNADPVRASFFGQLADGLKRQIPYDGRKTNISQFDAGFWVSGYYTDHDLSVLKKVPVCSLFLPFKGVNSIVTPLGTTVAAAQLRPPSTDVYINTKALKFLKQATILHETLHNLTGLLDYTAPEKHILDLKTFVGIPQTPGGTDDISKQLEDKGCAQPK